MLERAFEFTGACALDRLLVAVFGRLAPARPLPATPERIYNYGVDEVYRTAEGDGVSITHYNHGALPGDEVSYTYLAWIGDQLRIEAVQPQHPLVIQLRATPELIDVATDILLQLAAEHGLRFVRRTDVA